MDQSLVSAISQLGFPIILCLALLWWIHKQSARWADERDQVVVRMRQSEDWIRDTLLQINERLANTVRDNTHAMRDAARVHRDILIEMRSRPCLADINMDTPPLPAEQIATEPIYRKTPQP